MRLNVSAWSIRKPVPAIVLFMVLMVLGLNSFRDLPITRFPNIDLPIVKIDVTQAGAAPSELENQVAKKVEDAVAGVAGIKHITSTIADGISTTLIEFRLETKADRAVNDVKDAVARIRADLPRTIDEPIIQRLDIEGLPILTYAAASPGMTLEELSWFVDDVVARELQSVKGVGNVIRVGGIDREIRVALDPDRLLALGITAGNVNSQLRSTNVDLAGGRGEIAGREQSIRTLAGAQSVAKLAATSIALPNQRHVRLDDLGTVTDSAAEARTFAALNGDPVVAFAITRAKGASDAVVADLVAKKVAGLAKANPNVSLKLIDSQAIYTVGSYTSTMHTLLEGATLAIIVVLLFLKDWRATLISAIALPLSIVPTFWVMDVMGFSLNLVSLLSITIVTGILVDDAIVEIENIVRHMRMGKSPYRAALEAADEIGLAVIAITFTIVAVFMPVSFMGGIAGQYFKQFGLTVAVAVMFSLLVARLVTPMLAAYFMRDHGHVEPEDSALLRGYTGLVRWSVTNRFKTVGLGVCFFAASILSMKLLPSGFLPAEDNSRVLLALELPPGTRLDDSKAATKHITEQLRTFPEVKSIFVDGGRIQGGSAEIRKATLVIGLTPKETRARSQSDLKLAFGAALADVPDIRSYFMNDNGQRGLMLVVSGRDGAAVTRAAADLTSQMQKIPLLTNVVSTAELDRPELRIVPKPDVAAELGVSTEALSEAIRIGTIGDIGPNLAKFSSGERQIPIRVQLIEAARAEPQVLEQLKLQTGRGAAVPLSAVATIEPGQGPTSIDRYDRMRRVTIGGDLVGNTALGAALDQVYKLPAAMSLPAGVVLKQFGDAEVMAEVFESFAQAMGAGLMMVYSVLVLLFASFLHPVTILFSLPLSIGGAILALLLTSKAMSLPVVIGILMLMGIVTKNAIMLVDFAVEQMAAGMPRTEAIVDAGRKRARPIVMTTIAMAGGMFPSALALGAGGEFRAPMAIAVIGGVIVSTLLSLVFVPAFFALMDDGAKLLWRVFGRFVGAVDETDAAAEGAKREHAVAGAAE